MAVQEVDATEHQKNWEGFLVFVKYGIIGIAITLILMAAFLV